MNKVDLTEAENTLVRANAANVLSRFYDKWKPSFANDKIFFNETKTDLNPAYHHVLRTTGVNITTIKTFTIVVSANISSKNYTEQFYHVSVYLDAASINKFKTKDIDPVKLRNDFQAFHQHVLGSTLPENEACGLTFSFDYEGELLSIKMTFTHYDNQTARRVEHCLYSIDDIVELRKHNMVRSGVVNLCNFQFLWEHTSIEEIINTPDFYEAYKIYTADIERYHTLLQMEKI
jgi:hypothetical protein